MANPETGKTDNLAQEINASLTEGRLPCPAAFQMAKRMYVSLVDIGAKADDEGIKISNCQLGCFGKEKATHEELAAMQVSPAIEDAIRAELIGGKIPCRTAHEVAARLKTGRRKVGDTASKLNIRVSDCQLGCF